MRTLNLGILAHVDAGKTTLTERLLYAAGVIDRIGSVDDGTTQTDTLELERQRGITIRSAVVSFLIDDVTVNLIDTPGHPDFIAEVERVLDVLDGVVLVISAVEGVQAQTRVLMRALRRLSIPTLLFVNKIDRTGAGYARVLRAITEHLSPAIVPMGSVTDPGTRDARFTPFGATDAAFTTLLTERLADHDETLLAHFVEGGEPVPYEGLCDTLATLTRRSLVHPVFFGSAITGAGVEALTAGIGRLLPAIEGDGDGPVSGSVFKVVRGPAGERIAYVRLFSGSLRVRDRVRVQDGGRRIVTGLAVFERGAAVRRPSVGAGRIAEVWGLGDVRIGDAIGEARTASGLHFAPPTLETVVVPDDPADRSRLRVALEQLAEQDPLIAVRQDDVREELSVSLYGEIQKEVLQATLASEFGVEVGFRETTTICVERVIGTGAAVERMKEGDNPFLATIGLRIAPGATGSGVAFEIEAELGSMPLAYFRAVEDTVRETLRQGLRGWEVSDCTVTMTHSGYLGKHGLGYQYFNKSMSSTGEDFRSLTPLVLMRALARAGTVVCEPIHRFRVDAPTDTLPQLLPAMLRLRAVPDAQETRGWWTALEGDIPAASAHEMQLRLRSLTRGEGSLEHAFSRYQTMTGRPATRARIGSDPRNREDYLRRIARR